MFMKANLFNFTSRQIAICGALAALSMAAQFVFHIGYLNPISFIWIDLVGVFWIIAFLLFGFRGAMATSLISGLILILNPSGGIVGALMKFLATVCTWLGIYIFLLLVRKSRADFEIPLKMLGALILAIILRVVVMVPMYFYVAWPIYTGTSIEIGFQAVPWLLVALLNTIQAVVDVSLAWVLVYVFKISRFGEGLSKLEK